MKFIPVVVFIPVVLGIADVVGSSALKWSKDNNHMFEKVLVQYEKIQCSSVHVLTTAVLLFKMCVVLNWSIFREKFPVI